jgi:hypothetical protein
VSDTANVTALRPAVKDRTAAERSRRYRRRRKAKVREVPAPLPAPVTRVTRHGGRGVTVCITVAALALATVSAGFSITGMTAVFVGATLPVIGMGVALELGKLSAVACLGRRHGSAPLRAALVALVAVLMGLNAIGAYGFLAKAHIGHQVEGDVSVAGRAAEVDTRLSTQAGIVADLDRRIAQIDSAIETATQRGRTSAAMKLADEQRKSRAELAGQRIREAKTLADLRDREGRYRWPAQDGRGRSWARALSRDPARGGRPGRVALVHPGRGAVARSGRGAVAARSVDSEGEERMKQIVLDGMPIAADVPVDYPGPLEFFTASPEDMPKLLGEATRLEPHEALAQAARNSTIVAVSADERWIALVNKSPEGQFWCDITERSAHRR